MENLPSSGSCTICRNECPTRTLTPVAVVRPAVLAEIRREHPEIGEKAFLCKTDLARYRMAYVESILRTEKGDLGTFEESVFASLRDYELLAEHPQVQIEDHGHGFYRIRARFGYMEIPAIPRILTLASGAGFPCAPEEPSYFLSRERILFERDYGFSLWREALFS